MIECCAMKNLDITKLIKTNFQSFKKLLKKPRIKVLSLIILGALAFFLWRGFRNNKQQPQFQTVNVERGTIVSSVSASGQVLSVNIMSATTKASGIVKQVYVKDGDIVKAGDKILEIDLDQQGQQKNAQAYSAYLSAKNTLESAKAAQFSLQADMFGKWDVFKELAESDEYDTPDERSLVGFHIPEKEWLAAESKYRNQTAVIKQSQAAVNSAWLAYKLSSPIITAPTSGVITSLMFIKGMSIGSLDMGASESNQKVATVQAEGMPIVSVNLSEIDISQVRLGQKATIVLDSISDKTFTGKVAGVDKIGTYTSGVIQYPSIIQLDSGSVQILPNMAVTVNIIIDVKNNVLLVPSSGVIEQDGQTSVRLLKDKQQQTIPVEIGLTSDMQTEITAGLEEGDVIITGAISNGALQSETSPFSGTRGGFGGMMRGGPPH